MEKTVSQKKDYIEDLKSRNKDLTVEKDEITSKMVSLKILEKLPRNGQLNQVEAPNYWD